LPVRSGCRIFKLFRLNIELFEKIANTHDSLAEILLETGDRTGALVEYQRALALDPWNKSAAAAIDG
jgi:tetratricopeptide (TPR) repeat protein